MVTNREDPQPLGEMLVMVLACQDCIADIVQPGDHRGCLAPLLGMPEYKCEYKTKGDRCSWEGEHCVHRLVDKVFQQLHRRVPQGGKRQCQKKK